ncbi:peptidoglycan DD-metalloendopeptidase family protein [Rhodococcoides fascians]|uniref:M23 family metallopeptidase n=1 Tax=Rhodococcoides fascians TaxID=1828 RepID=UPI00050C6866|nr:M23 family metallopeptidase [Rhodococcus fascians]MDJ0410809.1 peptidoglycan DD-metalloendopeptidase family protein [Rhodococcus fascians]
MGSHRRSNIYVPAETASGTPGGKHRAAEEVQDTGRRAATIVAATGAIVVGATTMGAGTAGAAPVPEPPAAGFPFAVPEGVLPAGFELPQFVPPQFVPPQFELPQFAPPFGAPPQAAPDLAPAPQADPSAVPSDAATQAPTPGPLAALGPEVDAAAQQWLDDVGLGGTGAGPASPLESLRSLKKATVQPVAGVLTSNFGSRWGTQHSGLDIAAPIGTPIYAAADGTVSDAGPASGFGLWVKVLHDDGTETIYGHVNDFSVQPGQRVTAGEQIATVGNRGQSTGPHLHFEVHDPAGVKVDPAQWLSTRGVAVTWSDSASKA